MKGMWTKHFTKEGKVYYFNAALNKSVWNSPPSDTVVHEAPNLKIPEADDEEKKNEFAESIPPKAANDENHTPSLLSEASPSIATYNQSVPFNYLADPNFQVPAAPFYNPTIIDPSLLSVFPPAVPPPAAPILVVPPAPVPPSATNSIEEENKRKNLQLMLDMQAKIDQALVQKQKEIEALKNRKLTPNPSNTEVTSDYLKQKNVLEHQAGTKM